MRRNTLTLLRPTRCWPGLSLSLLDKVEGAIQLGDNWEIRVAVELNGLEHNDVIVDVRASSPSFKSYYGLELTQDNHLMLYVPQGFAHGFCALSEMVDVIYYVSAEYSPEYDGGILWNDPEIGVEWPVDKPLVSTKDAGLPLLREADFNFTYIMCS